MVTTKSLSHEDNEFVATIKEVEKLLDATKKKGERGNLIKSVNEESRDQCEAADALTEACCANANTSKDCVPL